jgi:RimJ/RimL family protein N-acetyltransferase
MPLETERCVLRWFEASDAEALHLAVDPHREALLPWLPWAAADHDSIAASDLRIGWFGGRRAGQDGVVPDYTMGIFEKGSGQLLGGTGLHRILPEHADAEIGYWLRADRWGEGFATEATAALISAAFGDWGFRRIRLVCSAANTPSRRIPERLGMRLEGCERANRWVDGHGWTDTLTFGVLAEEWDPGKQRVRS